jgi:hypothetical protein
MREEDGRDPFEDHINSESFDVDRLDESLPRSEMDWEIEQFFDELPYPLNHELWDTELDERQKLICAHLTTELIDRVMRVHHDDTLDGLNDDQLIVILTVPVILAMLAQQRLYHPKFAELKLPVLVPPALTKEEVIPEPPTFKARMNHWLVQTRDFIIRLFQRG